MFSRQIFHFVGAFCVLAIAYAIGFNVSVHTNDAAIESRYETLAQAGRYRAAAVYGQRLLAHRERNGELPNSLAPLKAQVAQTLLDAYRPADAVPLLETALASEWAKGLSPIPYAKLEHALAIASMQSGDYSSAVAIYAAFLRIAGDEVLPLHSHGNFSPSAKESHDAAVYYGKAVAEAAVGFADALTPLGDVSSLTGNRDERLKTLAEMSELGAHYALGQESLYSAAGLLATAHKGRRDILGDDDADTVQSAMILGPVYERLGRLEDAEKLYLKAFHAQEKRIGANSPELSLYMKLLAGVYTAQGRSTEAEALYKLMRALFRDAFGERRYAANQKTNRSFDVDRPVSPQFVLSNKYKPKDLVRAERYFVPLSKSPNVDEMKVRLALDNEAEVDAEENSLPARLARLISLCQSEAGERLSLRSGYRSFNTQRDLFARIGHKGRVTPPGMSEHQLGLAVDIDVNGRLMRQSDKSYRCFEENAFRFGFILSYPPGNNYLPGEDSFEPWHWRYVSIETARLYREVGPVGRPQEFLASLECYEKQAANGVFPIVGERDVCLTSGVQIADTGQENLAPADTAKTDKGISGGKVNPPKGAFLN